ncbi:hypothetical protein Tco_0657060 [Tanacetum coccineum]|uniref:Transposase (putative) gypsy type domain-containing protein n=1 Tax=Tanacetum coccineum TaxID=301880 RepID=A0ABQ4XAJ2_9ASTR
MGRDTIQLENAVSTISQEYLLEFTSEYGILEDLHPELPGPEDTIVDFPKGTVGVYTKFFEFANFRIPISQFLFDILGYYQIHLSQLSVIGAAKVSHFEINCRVLNIVPTLPLFRVFYVPSFNSGWMSFSKRPGKNTPQCYTKPLDSLKNWNNRFFWVDERIFPTIVDWRASAPKDGMPTADSYSAANVSTLDTRQMDLFNLISAPNPSKVKTGIRPCAAHEMPLLTATTNRVIDIEDPTMASGSSGTPFTVERSPLDFDNENPAPIVTEGTGVEDQAQDVLAPGAPPKEAAATTEVVQEALREEEVVAMEPPVNKRRKQMRRKRVNEEVEVNVPPKVLRKDHVSSSAHSIHGGKSLAAMGLDAGFTFSTPDAQDDSTTAKSVSDPDPLSYSKPQPFLEQDIAQSSKGTATEIPPQHVAAMEVNVQLSVGSPDSGKSTSVTSVEGSPSGIYQPVCGVTNSCRVDTPEACQDLVAMGSQLRLRFKQDARLLKKARAKIARRDQRIQVREEEMKKLDQEIQSLRVVESEVHGLRNRTQNLETLLEAEVDMKKAAEAKNAELTKELEILRVQFSNLQVNNDQLSQQEFNLQAQVTGEERIKAAFEEFKKYEDNKVEQRCAEMDARLDKLSVDIDEELYPHMLTAIAGRRWVIGHDLRLAVMKCAESSEIRQAFANVVSAGLAKGMSEGLKYNIEYGKAGRDLEKFKEYQIESKMASLHLESNTEDENLKYPIKNVPLEMLLWRQNISRAEKKKKCRVVCRTHGIGSAHHARFDGILVSVPTVVPQGLAILLTDAGTQT